MDIAPPPGRQSVASNLTTTRNISQKPSGIPATSPSSSSQRFKVNKEKENMTLSPSGENFGITSLSAFLFDESDTNSRRKKQLFWAKDALEELEKLKIELLNGTLTKEMLERLNTLLQAMPKERSDEKLHEILLEIETRLAVELAKYDVS